MSRQMPSNWSQEASDAALTLAERSVEMAEDHPGEWINPTPLKSRIRYNEDGTWTVYTHYYLGDLGRYEERQVYQDTYLAQTLREAWVWDLGMDDSRQNARYVEKIIDLADMGI